MTPLFLALKDLRLLMRDKVALFWALLFPLMFAGLFGAVLRRSVDGRPTKLAVAVVDEDGSAASKALVKALEENPDLVAARTSADEARKRVLGGDAIATVRVPKGFGGPAIDGKAQPVELAVDPSRRGEGAWLQLALSSAIASHAPPSCATPSIESRTVDPGGSGSAGGATGYQVAFPAAVLWGLVGCAGSFAGAMVAERRSGTFLRLRAAPLARGTLLGGKVLACFVACAADAALLWVLARFALELKADRPLLLILGVASCAACFAGLTVFLGSLGKSEQAVSGAAWATLLLLAMVGGAMVPRSVMPPALRAIGEASPIRWGISVLEGATFRAAPVTELLRPMGLLVCTGMLAFFAASALARRQAA
jgi:ABC-2 type transport system permease protein